MLEAHIHEQHFATHDAAIVALLLAWLTTVKIAFRVWNLTPNSIPFSSFNIHAIWMQWTLVLQLKSTKFHNINVDRSELESGVSGLIMGIFETNN
ncbi:hypothetical protein SFRURICE_018497 [Spodoptera frugiperda]|nr:hypothetical protein SFRURICE_018497 [Spodoptera frugiperda]